MTTMTDPPCAVCGNGTHRMPWGTEVPETDRAAIELDGTRYPVQRCCMRSFVTSREEDEEAWDGQRRTVAAGQR